LAALVSEEDLNRGSLYPPLNTIQKCSLNIAAKIAEYAYEHGKLHVKLLLDFLICSTIMGINGPYCMQDISLNII
jgi:hypothetical protein